MRKSCYEHFKRLYSDFDGAVVCCDDKTKIIYCTRSVYELFDLSEKALSYIGCILPHPYPRIINDMEDEPHCVSFDFYDQIRDRLLKCTVTPVLFERIYFYTFSFFQLPDDEQENIFPRIVDSLAREMAIYTINLVNSAEWLKEYNEVAAQEILDNVVKLRKLYLTIETLMLPNKRELTTSVTELGGYMKRITSIVHDIIGTSRVDFKFDMCDEILISRITYQDLDLICCNAIASSIRNSIGKAHITIGLAKLGNKNMIVFSDSDVGARQIKALISRGLVKSDSKIMSADDTALAVMRKAAARNGGKVFINDNPVCGVSTAVVLPECEMRKNAFYQPDTYDTDSLFSTIRLILSDI